MAAKSIAHSTPNVVIEREYLKPAHIPHWLNTAGLAMALVAVLYSTFVQHQMHDFGAGFAIAFLLVAMALSIFVTPKHFVIGFLPSLMLFLVAWRIAAMSSFAWKLKADGGEVYLVGERPWMVMIVCGVVSCVFVAQFIDTWINDYRHLSGAKAYLETLVWTLTLSRIYFGFNELCHATEKIFAGQASFDHLVDVFGVRGISAGAGFFVILGGLIEAAIAFGVGCGFMTRLAGFGGFFWVFYAVIFHGQEFTHGYTWNAGGWEYPMLLMVFFFGFMFSGGGRFSLDSWMASYNMMPAWLSRFSFNKKGRDIYAAQAPEIRAYLINHHMGD